MRQLLLVLVLLPGAALAQGRAAPEPPGLQLVRKFLELGQRSQYTPAEAAAQLGVKLGPAQRSTEYRTDHALSGGNVKSGEISSAAKWRMVEVEPAPALGLTLDAVLPLLLDLPHSVDMQTGHDGDGTPSLIRKDHLFLVKGGMLVVSVAIPDASGSYRDQLVKAHGSEWDAAAGKQQRREPVTRLLLTNEPRAGLDKAPSLRAFRQQVRQAPASPAKPPAPPSR
jgi:hypothetical protein